MSDTPHMSKREFEYIAFILSRADDNMTKQQLIDLFVKHLKLTNPKFNVPTFKGACTYYGNRR